MTLRSTSDSKLNVRELAELALLCALIAAGKEAMRVLPNIHPVTLLLLLGTLVYGARALYPAFGFVLLEIAIYGFGVWNIPYLYAWPIVVLCALPFRRERSRLFWAGFAALHGLLFGALCAIPYLFIGGWAMALSWWASGIPFDLVHAASNAVLVYFLLLPLYNLVRKLKN